jgi:small ligand-binding sensory domain FIST
MRWIRLACLFALLLGCNKTQTTAPGTGGAGTGGVGSLGGRRGSSDLGPSGYPALSVSPSAVNLGTLGVGESGMANVTVINTGTASSGPINITACAGVTATGRPQTRDPMADLESIIDNMAWDVPRRLPGAGAR